MKEPLRNNPEFWDLVAKLEKEYGIDREEYLKEYFPSIHILRRAAVETNTFDEFMDKLREAKARDTSVLIQGEVK
jgi:hypothetical protein